MFSYFRIFAIVAIAPLASVAQLLTASAQPRPAVAPSATAQHVFGAAPPIRTVGRAPRGVHPAGSRPGGYIPCDVYGATGLTNTVSAGRGVLIAIIDAYDQPSITSDLHAFDQGLGLPDAPSFQVYKPWGQPAQNQTWGSEITLDVEWSHAMAPGASIALIEAPSSNVSYPAPGASGGDLTAAIWFAVHTLNADVVSMSFSSAESGLSATDEAGFHPYFPTSNPAGRMVTYLAATGDTGFGAAWPAVDPGVVGVGGTSLSPAAFGYTTRPGPHSDCSGATLPKGANQSNQTVWGQQGCNPCQGTGGGSSAYQPKPAWQSVAPGSMRGTPDVAMLADPYTGVSTYQTGVTGGPWDPFGITGGTSLATPLWAGVIARLDESQRAANLPNLGVSGTSSWAYQGTGVSFNDVVSGASPPNAGDVCASPGGPCRAAAGYDLVTGRGSPSLGGPAATQYFTPANGYSSVLVNQDGHLEAFYRQGDSTVVHSWQGSWGTWYALASGRTMQTAPVASLNADGRGEAVAVGSNGVVYHTWQPNWPAWTSLAALPSGVTFTGQATLTRNIDGRMEAFARGSDAAYWHAWQLTTGAGWSAWSSLAGSFASDPSVTQNTGDGHLEIFGTSTSGQVMHSFQGAGWSAWYGLGATTFASRADVVRNTGGPLELFAVGTDGELHHQWQTPGRGTGWSGWYQAGTAPSGGWQGNPSVTANPDGRLEVFARGAGGAIWHAWQPAWTSWASLGGPLQGDPVVLQETLYPDLDLWAVGTNGQTSEQWRGTDNVWSGWQSRGGSLEVP
jgi:hypothetical protein